MGEGRIGEIELQWFQDETNKLIDGLCGGNMEILQESQEFQRKFKTFLNHVRNT